MGVVPDDKVGKIQFCESHVSPWTTNAVAIGTTAATVTAWSTLVTAARTAYNAQLAAQSAAKDATINLNLAIQQMMDSTTSIIKQVRAKADLSGDGVYALASLPVPATPSPKAAPGKPYGLDVSLDGNGAIELKWKCDNPAGTSGTIYQVWRQIGPAAGNSAVGSGELTYVGGSGTKSFVDDTLPAGSTQVMYQIQGVRSTAVGPWMQFNVNFGVSSTGPMVASIVEGAPAKIAA